MGTLKGDQKNEILSRLDAEPIAKKEFNKIKNAWALAATKKEMPGYQLESLYLDFKKRLGAKRKPARQHILGYARYAAVFIFAIGISTLVFYVQSNRFNDLNAKTKYTTAIADNGQISKIILPDSSVVWLNSGSKITYNNNFSINNREIALSGQAFFKVTKNEKIPLKVFCDQLEVRVLGTCFNVTAYPEDKNIVVALESGKVDMWNSKIKSFHYELNPGEMARYELLSGKVSLEEVNLKKFTSWKEGILIFRDEPMAEVIPRLERRYNIDIEVAQADIYQSVFTATIKNETLDEIFKSISFACSIHYTIIPGDTLSDKTRIVLKNKSHN